MTYTSEKLKELYPIWWENKQRQELKNEIERILMDAELRIAQFVDMKMKEITDKIESANINVTTVINDSAVTNDTINREIRKMVLKEIEKAFS